MTADPVAAGELLEWLYSQSYDKKLRPPTGSRKADRPPLPPGKLQQLGGAAVRLLDEAPFGARRQRPVAPSASLGALLFGAAGVVRHELHNEYNPHLTIPSARSVAAARVFVLCAGGAAAYVPERHALLPVGGWDPARLASGYTVAIVGDQHRVADRYGRLRYALAVLEAGHSLSNLALAAEALGVDLTVQLDFADAALLRRLSLEARSPIPVALAHVGGGDELGLELEVPADEADEVGLFDRLTWPGAAPEDRRPGAGARWSRPLAAPHPHRESVADALYARTAGRGWPGITGRIATLPAEALRCALWQAGGAVAGSLAGLDLPGLRLVFAVERVDGMEEGLHECALGSGDTRLLQPGKFLGPVQFGFSYPPTSMSIETFNLAAFLVVDYPRLLDACGPRGVRFGQIAMGAVSQRLSLALGLHGLFARPCRSFNESVLDRVLGLRAGEVVGYELLAGYPRFRDLPVDLRIR